MKFAALVSGGKDSLYSTLLAIRNGHTLQCCIHLGAPETVEEESFMYQTAASNVVPVLVQECLRVPLIHHVRTGKSLNTFLVYQQNDDQHDDEVEDLFQAIQEAKKQFPDLEAISSGAILSTYQRVRVEHVCSRLGLVSLGYLWRLAPQRDIVQQMLQNGMDIVLVKTACPPGLTAKHLNQPLTDLSGLLDRLQERFHFHYCGEGGEYESLVLDCPLYYKRLVLDKVEIVETDDGVGELIIQQCHAEEKTDSAENRDLTLLLSTQSETTPAEKQAPSLAIPTQVPVKCLPFLKRIAGGLVHLSEIMSPAPSTLIDKSQAAIQEALSIFDLLKLSLQSVGATPHDVMFVHLYLSEMSLFANINQHYRNVFGTLLPPSRSCVALGNLSGGRHVMMDCIVQLGSGRYLRNQPADGYSTAALQTKTFSLRQVLHVQSLSHWAPVCVGPYSQVNTLRDGLHLMAGQIGLDPPTMVLKPTWQLQLDQCWTNVAHILDALEGASLQQLMSCLIYVSHAVSDWSHVKHVSHDAISVTNAHVVPGAVDSSAATSGLHGGYEDEDTWREMEAQSSQRDWLLPLLLVQIPEMPVGASIELECIAVTKKAASCMDVLYSQHDSCSSSHEPSFGWDTGHDFEASHEAPNSIQYLATTVALGRNCAAMGTVAASTVSKEGYDLIIPEHILADMLDAARTSLSPVIACEHAIHVRLFYLASMDDGARWRSSLATALGSRPPASSIVPVQGMQFFVNDKQSVLPFVAIQVLAIDSVGMETELWINYGRDE